KFCINNSEWFLTSLGRDWQSAHQPRGAMDVGPMLEQSRHVAAVLHSILPHVYKHDPLNRDVLINTTLLQYHVWKIAPMHLAGYPSILNVHATRFAIHSSVSRDETLGRSSRSHVSLDVIRDDALV